MIIYYNFLFFPSPVYKGCFCCTKPEMPYTTPSDVRMVIHTDLTDTDITQLITQTDAEIDKQLGTQDPTDKLIQKLSTLITSRTIKHRQPSSTTIGEYRSETTDTLSAEINRITRLYKQPTVKASTYSYKEEQE